MNDENFRKIPFEDKDECGIKPLKNYKLEKVYKLITFNVSISFFIF